MVLVWRITDDLPNSPNFLPAKLSHYETSSAAAIELLNVAETKKMQLQLN